MARWNRFQLRPRAAILAGLLASMAPAAYAQAAPAGAQTRQEIVDKAEAEAEAYQFAISQTPIEVRQTVRYYDASGHLKSTHSSSFTYAFAATGVRSVKAKPGATAMPDEQLSGVVLSDGVSLPLLFLPGSIIHLSVNAETPAAGPWILHFKSSPCGSPEVRRHWMDANVVSQCVEGEAFFDPESDSIARIRMRMAGLPIGFRSLAYPAGVIVLEISNDATYRLLKTTAGAPRLVPEKAEYVTYTTRDRTVVDQTFEFTTSAPSQHQTTSGSARE
jgi:hypothetical protein